MDRVTVKFIKLDFQWSFDLNFLSIGWVFSVYSFSNFEKWQILGSEMNKKWLSMGVTYQGGKFGSKYLIGNK